MPLLFGPLFLTALSRSISCGGRLIQYFLEGAPSVRAKVVHGHGGTELLLIASIFLPLFILSLAPHQEPRFLLPLALPVVLLGAQGLVGSPYIKKVGFMR